jgi:hypothetical protein
MAHVVTTLTPPCLTEAMEFNISTRRCHSCTIEAAHSARCVYPAVHVGPDQLCWVPSLCQTRVKQYQVRGGVRQEVLI